MRIPASTAIKVFNRITGANCATLQETVEYLKSHPEAKKLLEIGPVPSRIQ